MGGGREGGIGREREGKGPKGLARVLGCGFDAHRSEWTTLGGCYWALQWMLSGRTPKTDSPEP